MEESLWEQATESDWPEEERRQWYREHPADREYYRIQRELLRDGLTRKAKLTQLPPHQEGEHTLWAIGFEGKSPLRLPEAEPTAQPLLPAAREPRLRRRAHRAAEARPGGGVGRGAGDDPALPQVHQRRCRRALPQVGPRGQLGERAAGPRLQLLWPATATAHQLLVKMEERRRGGFRVKPSFGQVLGYIQEDEPLALDLPNRKASIYTSSHPIGGFRQNCNYKLGPGKNRK